MFNLLPAEICFEIVKFLNIREDFLYNKFYLINENQFYRMTKGKYFWKYFLNRLYVDTKNIVLRQNISKYSKVPFSPKNNKNIYRKLFKREYVRWVVYLKYLRTIKMVNEGGFMSTAGFKRMTFPPYCVFSKIFSLYEKGFSKNKHPSEINSKFDEMQKNGKFFEYFWVKDIYRRVQKFYKIHGKSFFGGLNFRKNKRFLRFGKKFQYEFFYVLISDYLMIRKEDRSKYEREFIKIFEFFVEVLPMKKVQILYNLNLFELLFNLGELSAMKALSKHFHPTLILSSVRNHVQSEKNVRHFFDDLGVDFFDYFRLECNVTINFERVLSYFLERNCNDVKLIQESVQHVFGWNKNYYNNRISMIEKYGEYIDVTDMKFFARFVRNFRRKNQGKDLKGILEFFFEKLKMDKKLINKEMNFSFLGNSWSGKGYGQDNDNYTKSNMQDKEGTFMHQFVLARSAFAKKIFSDAFEYLVEVGGDVFKKNGIGKTSMDILFFDHYVLIRPPTWGNKLQRSLVGQVSYLSHLPKNFYVTKMTNGYSPLYNVVFKMFARKSFGANMYYNHTTLSVYFVLKAMLDGGAVFCEELNEEEEKLYQLEMKRVNYIFKRSRVAKVFSYILPKTAPILDEIEIPQDFFTEDFSD